MNHKNANKIRSFLLNKINNEILSNFKREQHMRINGYNIKELYDFNCENFEICIINKTIIGSQVTNSSNSSRKRKNYSTLHLDIIPINLLEKIEGANEDNLLVVNSKKLLSYQKLKDPKIPSLNIKKKEIINSYKNQNLLNENKRIKDGFKTMRKILHFIKNKSYITFKDLKTPRNVSKNSFKNIIPKRRNYKNKSTKVVSTHQKNDFKIELINMSYDDNNIDDYKKEIEKNKINSILKKENMNMNTKNNHPTFSNYIKHNNSNIKKKKINFENLKNKNYEKYNESKTERPKITKLTLQDDSF